MAFSKPQSSDQGLDKQRGQAKDQGVDSGARRLGSHDEAMRDGGRRDSGMDGQGSAKGPGGKT